jgi:hypothetical protein
MGSGGDLLEPKVSSTLLAAADGALGDMDAVAITVAVHDSSVARAVQHYFSTQHGRCV